MEIISVADAASAPVFADLDPLVIWQERRKNNKQSDDQDVLKYFLPGNQSPQPNSGNAPGTVRSTGERVDAPQTHAAERGLSMTEPMSEEQRRAIDAKLSSVPYFAQVLNNNFDKLDTYHNGRISFGQLEKAINDPSFDPELRRAAEIVSKNRQLFTFMNGDSSFLSHADIDEFVAINNGVRFGPTETDLHRETADSMRVGSVIAGLVALNVMRQGWGTGIELATNVAAIAGFGAGVGALSGGLGLTVSSMQRQSEREELSRRFEALNYFDLPSANLSGGFFDRSRPPSHYWPSPRVRSLAPEEHEDMSKTSLTQASAITPVDKPFSGQAHMNYDEFISTARGKFAFLDQDKNGHLDKDELEGALDDPRLNVKERETVELMRRYYDQLNNFSHDQLTGFGPKEIFWKEGISTSDLKLLDTVVKDGTGSASASFWASLASAGDMRYQAIGAGFTVLASLGAVKSWQGALAFVAAPTVVQSVRGWYDYQFDRRAKFDELLSTLQH